MSYFSSSEPEDGPSIDGLSTSPRASIGECVSSDYHHTDSSERLWSPAAVSVLRGSDHSKAGEVNTTFV